MFKNFLLAAATVAATSFAPIALAEVVIVRADRAVSLNLVASVTTPQCCTVLAQETIQTQQRSDARLGRFTETLERSATAEAEGLSESARGSASQESSIAVLGDILTVSARGFAEASRVVAPSTGFFFPRTSGNGATELSMTFTVSTPLLYFASVEFLSPSVSGQFGQSASLRGSRAGTFDEQTVFLTTTGANVSGVLAAGTYTLAISARATLDSFGREVLRTGQGFALDFRTSPVPLPASAWLLLSAFGGLWFSARRQGATATSS